MPGVLGVHAGVEAGVHRQRREPPARHGRGTGRAGHHRPWPSDRTITRRPHPPGRRHCPAGWIRGGPTGVGDRGDAAEDPPGAGRVLRFSSLSLALVVTDGHSAGSEWWLGTRPGNRRHRCRSASLPRRRPTTQAAGRHRGQLQPRSPPSAVRRSSRPRRSIHPLSCPSRNLRPTFSRALQRVGSAPTRTPSLPTPPRRHRPHPPAPAETRPWRRPLARPRCNRPPRRARRAAARSQSFATQVSMRRCRKRSLPISPAVRRTSCQANTSRVAKPGDTGRPLAIRPEGFRPKTAGVPDIALPTGPPLRLLL